MLHFCNNSYLIRCFLLYCVVHDRTLPRGEKMIEIRIVLAAAVAATCLVLVVTITAGAQTTDDRSTVLERGATQPSQGTVTGATQAQLDAVRRDLVEEERLADYTRVVDDTSGRLFNAPGWKVGATSDLAHGGSYATPGAGAADARFKLNVPTSSDYAIYAWWPSRRTNSTAARFGVRTSSGTNWTTVDQSRDGGYWVQIGTYNMKAGEYYAVRLSSRDGTGQAVADAVALVRGVTTPPPSDPAPADGGPVSAGVKLDGDGTYSASALSGRVKGRRLIRRGRWHIGTPYRLSPPAPCWAYVKEDCSCFTKIVFRRFKRIRDSPVIQFQYGHKVRSRSHLNRGDLVFFKERGYGHPITHVGIYSGNGHILHASSYFGKVVNSKMKYIRNYYGARRIQPRL
jgi:cell wall-associated NlpC family hydrolase